ncbi:MAG: decaprenyl-phosphate phosphoribosyltransferase [Rhodocyclaceae bacterium]|nr:MAG: decaprenyl-phosphate phosphoribosyltransferase [Rhodocyclaceae bacterium]
MKAWLKLLRPHQWVKSGFVFVGLLFGHAWHDAAVVQQVLLAAVAFSLAASAVYVGNDIVDRERDRQHPDKRRRPLASGAITPGRAMAVGVSCVLAALGIAWLASPAAAAIIVAYLLLNIGYTLGLKHIVLLDVFIISAGFMLRILAGTLGVGIAPSHWLLLCGFMVTLFLGFAKRRAELKALDGDASGHRQVLEDYDPVLLDKLIGVCAAATIVTYSLYTVAADTAALHGTGRLFATVPFVVYGMFRYLFLLHRRDGGGDPAAELLSDRHLLLAVAGWLTTVLVVLS